MRVAVLGGGVVGVAAAYYLSQDGHEVALIDRNALPASETSYGNAGLVSPGDSYAWASPAALKMFVKSLVRSDLGIKVRPQPRSPFPGLDLASSCCNARPAVPTSTRCASCASRCIRKHCINALAQHTGVQYDRGAIAASSISIRSQESLDAGVRHMQILADHGLKIDVVGRERLVEIDPGLAARQGQDRRRDLFADRPDRRFLPVRAQPDRLVRAACRRQVSLRRYHP